MQKATMDALETALATLRLAQRAVESDTNNVLLEDDHVLLVRHFAKLREVNEMVKIARKSLELIEDRLSHTEIPDAFKRAGIKNVFIEDVGRVSIGHRWSCSMIDKQVGMQYLREVGDGGLIIETVNSSTLAAHAKNLNDQGKELPEDKFKTSINAYTSITKE